MGKDSENRHVSIVGVAEHTSKVLCLKCDKMVEPENPEVTEKDNGIEKTKGNCPNCGSKIIVNVVVETEENLSSK